jgi:hypothetical protein
MQQFMNVVQEFEAWSDIQVNTTTPESEDVRYLGFWTTPNGNMKSGMDLVFERTLKAKETIQGHPLDPKQSIGLYGERGGQFSIPGDGTMETTRLRQIGPAMETRLENNMETQRKHCKSPVDVTEGYGGYGIYHNTDRHYPHPPRPCR